MSFVVILHNIRSAHNVGSMFRTADGAGVEKLFLTGYTPRPLPEKRSQLAIPTKAQKEIAKTALGAERTLSWEYRKTLRLVWEELRRGGYRIIAVEQSSRSVPYDTYVPQGKVALLMGNEVRGIDPKTLKKCDAVIEIPMRGSKNSLNVSVAFGIASYVISSTIKKENKAL